MIAHAILLVTLTTGTVSLRGGGTVDTTVEEVSLAGVRVGGTAPRTISWDRVREVNGDFANEAQAFKEFSDDAWRARTRLDRGDVFGAKSLLTELEERCAGQIGATPVVVFAMALDIHLRTGDQPDALRAYFELRRQVTDQQDWVRLGFDPATGLVPQLAPFFVSGQQPDALQTLAPDPADTPELARLRAAFAAAASSNPALLPEGGGKTPAELLLGRVARAASGDALARTELLLWERDNEDDPAGAWRSAWVRAAIARGMLVSADPAIIRRGAVEFLHIPAAPCRGDPVPRRPRAE